MVTMLEVWIATCIISSCIGQGLWWWHRDRRVICATCQTPTPRNTAVQMSAMPYTSQTGLTVVPGGSAIWFMCPTCVMQTWLTRGELPPPALRMIKAREEVDNL